MILNYNDQNDHMVTVLCKSMKLWAIPWRATQGQVVETYYKTWSTGEVNGKLLQPSCLENPMNSMKRQKDMTLKDELPRSVGAQYATGEEWRNSSRRNEKTKPRNWKTHSLEVKLWQTYTAYLKAEASLCWQSSV